MLQPVEKGVILSRAFIHPAKTNTFQKITFEPTVFNIGVGIILLSDGSGSNSNAFGADHGDTTMPEWRFALRILANPYGGVLSAIIRF